MIFHGIFKISLIYFSRNVRMTITFNIHCFHTDSFLFLWFNDSPKSMKTTLPNIENIYFFFLICTVNNIRLVFKHIFYLVNNLNNTTNIITIIIIVQSNMSLDQNFWENNCINLKCWKTRNERFFLCYWKRVRDEKKCFT